MPIVKVARKSIKKLSGSGLNVFAKSILKNCAERSEYAPLQSVIHELRIESDKFAHALVAAHDRSVSNVVAKSELRKKLVEVLFRFSDWLEFHAENDSYIVGAGMRAQAGRQNNFTEIPAPFIARLMPTGNAGEVSVKIKLPDPALVQMNALEYSVDGGQTWHNGLYQRSTKMLVRNLPSQVRVQFRVRSMGTRGRVSAWSAVAAQVVL